MKIYLEYLSNLFNFKDPIDEKTYKKYSKCMLITLFIAGLILIYFVGKKPDVEYYTEYLSDKEIKKHLFNNLLSDLIYILFVIIMFLLNASIEIRKYITAGKSPRAFIIMMFIVLLICFFVIFFDYLRGHLAQHNYIFLLMWAPFLLTDFNKVFKRKDEKN